MSSHPRIRPACPGSVIAPIYPPQPLVPGVLFDRDGVLNVDRGYVHRIEDFEWTPGSQELMASLKEQEIRMAVCTNQSGIGRGLYTEEDFLKVSEWLLEQAPVEAIYYCPHHPDENCPARKPGDLMLLKAMQELALDPARTCFIGDKESDREAAERAGIPFALVKDDSLQGLELPIPV